jgi:hypothetical protein
MKGKAERGKGGAGCCVLRKGQCSVLNAKDSAGCSVKARAHEASRV